MTLRKKAFEITLYKTQDKNCQQNDALEKDPHQNDTHTKDY
jgi:hypothetical protein